MSEPVWKGGLTGVWRVAGRSVCISSKRDTVSDRVLEVMRVKKRDNRFWNRSWAGEICSICGSDVFDAPPYVVTKSIGYGLTNGIFRGSGPGHVNTKSSRTSGVIHQSRVRRPTQIPITQAYRGKGTEAVRGALPTQGRDRAHLQNSLEGSSASRIHFQRDTVKTSVHYA